MTKTPTPASHAVTTAPISADLRQIPGLSEQDAVLLEQAASMLEGLHNDERNRGNCSAAEGARCSADAVRRLAVQLLPAAPASPAQQDAAVTDEMALAFHRAISDGAIGQDDVNDIKAGLRAALCNFPGPAQAQQDAPAAVAAPDERAAFEAWGRSLRLGLERVGNRPYYWQYARWAWDAWQARAALAAAPAAPASQDAAPDLEGEALRACRDLPDGWEIEIHLEQGYGSVTLIDPDGNDDELPAEGGLTEALRTSIDAALAAQQTGGTAC